MNLSPKIQSGRENLNLRKIKDSKKQINLKKFKGSPSSQGISTEDQTTHNYPNIYKMAQNEDYFTNLASCYSDLTGHQLREKIHNFLEEIYVNKLPNYHNIYNITKKKPKLYDNMYYRVKRPD